MPHMYLFTPATGGDEVTLSHAVSRDIIADINSNVPAPTPTPAMLKVKVLVHPTATMTSKTMTMIGRLTGIFKLTPRLATLC